MDSETDDRFSAGEGFRGGLHPAAFSGRRDEMAALDAALDRSVRLRAPQFVTVVGPLGIGKTRLWAEWLAGVSGLGFRIARVALSATGRGQAGGNLIGALLRHRFGISPSFSPEAALVQFRAEMQRVFSDRRVAEVAALLGRFLGFELRESPLSQAIGSTPSQARDLAQAVLCRFLEEDARESPLVVAVDDLHLADEESLDILERIPGELGQSAVVVVGTARHDLIVRRPGWGQRADGSVRLELGPLGRSELDEMIQSVLDAAAAGGAPLPAALLERAAVESGGNPYFVEQLLHVYSRHGVLVAVPGQGWSFDAEKAAAAPISLNPEESSVARIASLSPLEREVLARAAIFGTVFWTGGVVALGRVTGEPTDSVAVFAPDQSILDLRDILAHLATRDLLAPVAESSLPGDAEWAFKHVRDAELLLSGVNATALGQMRRFAAQWLESRGVSFRW
jgi:predicted ATPase